MIITYHPRKRQKRDLGKTAGPGYGKVAGGVKMNQKRREYAHEYGGGLNIIAVLSSQYLTMLIRKATH